MKIFFKILASLVSAVLLYAVFPPRGETVNLVFALAPMLVIARRSRPFSAFGWWALFGCVFWFATLSWMPAICKNNGPWVLVVLGWTLLAALCSLYFAVFGFLNSLAWQRAQRLTRFRQGAKIAMLLVIEPSLWAGLEWLRGTLFTGFAWNFLGTGTVAIPALTAPARLGGVYLISALVVMLNGVFATLIIRALSPMFRTSFDNEIKHRRFWHFLETALPLVAIYLALEGAAIPKPEAGKITNLRVALIQRNAPSIFSSRTAEDPLRPFFELLDKAAAARPDLVLLAESAFTEFGPVRSDRARNAALHFANRCSAAAVIGGGDDVVYSNGVRKVYNAAACYSPAVSNALAGVYHKQHLVPFGEYIFWDKLFPCLQRFSPIGVSLYPGEGTLFDVNGLKIAPLICFEDTIPSLSRAAARSGADAIALITNDSWFSYSSEAEQHAAQAVLRAVETGLPILRVGNSGVTGIILPSGHTRFLTDGDGRVLVDQSGCQVESLAIRHNVARPVYVKVGDVPLLVIFALSLLFCLSVPYYDKLTLSRRSN